MVVSIKGKKYWLWRAVDANGYVLDALLQSRRNKGAALRLMQIVEEPRCCAARDGERQAAFLFRRKARDHAGDRTPFAQRAQQPRRKFSPSRSTTRATHDAVQVGRSMPTFRLNPRPKCQSFQLHRKHLNAPDHRQLRALASATWREIALPIQA